MKSLKERILARKREQNLNRLTRKATVKSTLLNKRSILAKDKDLPYYLGIKDVLYIYNGHWSDPYVCYKDHLLDEVELYETMHSDYEEAISEGYWEKDKKITEEEDIDNYIRYNADSVKEVILEQGRKVRGVQRRLEDLGREQLLNNNIKITQHDIDTAGAWTPTLSRVRRKF